VPARLTGWSAAILATLVTPALVAGELTNAAQRRWWAPRPLTTETVAGLLVLLITVLVVNQLLSRRQSRQRGHAIAAQAAIMVAQAARSAKATSSLLDGSGDRDAASDGFRTYMMMLLICAPVLMDDPVARRFLEHGARHDGDGRLRRARDLPPVVGCAEFTGRGGRGAPRPSAAGTQSWCCCLRAGAAGHRTAWVTA
jgi:hypothetical protein